METPVGGIFVPGLSLLRLPLAARGARPRDKKQQPEPGIRLELFFSDVTSGIVGSLVALPPPSLGHSGSSSPGLSLTLTQCMRPGS